MESSQEVLIQVTPVSATLAANAALNATGLSALQLSGQATSSGLSYAANGQLNNLYAQVSAAESVSGLLAATAPAAAAAFESTVGAPADSYSPIALYDIAASAGAANAIAQGGAVDVAITVPRRHRRHPYGCHLLGPPGQLPHCAGPGFGGRCLSDGHHLRPRDADGSGPGLIALF